MPHHLRAHEVCAYREGVATKSSQRGTEVDVGLSDPCFATGVQIPPHTRVTLKIKDDGSMEAEAVAPTAPREEGGYYWGYTVRRCSSLSSVFTECPFDGGYDVSFGTSERGIPVSDVQTSSIPRYNHFLIAFGGVAGLEMAARNDPELVKRGVNGGTVRELFDYWVNLVPGQGSRTIRTEEAVWCGLIGLRGVVEERRAES
jgi:methyltransferase